MLEMQRRAETLFIRLQAETRASMAAQGARPKLFTRPARPTRAYRLLMRLVPRLARRWQVRALRQSGLLDPDWYLENYEDVRAAGTDPALHYLLFGAAEGRDPGPGFSTQHYLRLYPDVRQADINPVIHYLTAGWDEKRSIHLCMPEGQA